MARGLYTARRQRGHIGICERCGQRKPTARFRDDGIMFRRLDREEGGHWLCQTCVIELEEKRDAVKKGMDP